MSGNTFQFDVALSFAGEQRDYVRKVFNYIEDKGVRAFFDEARKTEMWGKNLVEYFHEVFETNARFCVMFVSREYKEKIWTNFEREIIEARSLVEKGYILPARFDKTELLGLPSTISYIDISRLSPEDFGQIIVEKVLERKSEADLIAPKVTYRQPKINKGFNPYNESKEWIQYITEKLQERSNSLIDINVSFSEFDREGKKCLRIVSENGETIYSLDISMGTSSGDKGLSFSGGQGEIGYSRGTNASGEFEWNSDSNDIVINLSDYSLLDNFNNSKNYYTKERFLESLWDKIVDAVEQYASKK